MKDLVENQGINLKNSLSLAVGLIGAIIWMLTFFAWAKPTEKRLDHHDQNFALLDQRLDQISDDLSRIRGILEKK